MLYGLYSAATAIDSATQNQEIVAENLANASTPGFRRHGLVFETLHQDLSSGTPVRSANASSSPSNPALGTRPAGHYTSFEPGPLQYTGNQLDFALSPDAYFSLDTPSGRVYTRNGIFRLDNQGQMVSVSGYPVRSQGGRLIIPQNTSRITVAKDGSVYADNNIVGQLEISVFPQPNAVLQRVGPSLFSGPSRTNQQGLVSYRVEQGYREGSNVQIVNEMVSMVTGMRHYEAAQKALQALGEAISQNTRPGTL